MKAKYILMILILILWGKAMAKEDGQYWNKVYETRYKFIEDNIGPLPDDILKIMHMSGSWPGGGLYKFKASKLGNDLWAYMTFGLTNPDMPTAVTPKNVQIKGESDRPESTSLTLEKKPNVPSYPDRNGYGYELIVVTKGEKEWPLWLLQWAVEAELINDVDILGRVEKYNGLTIEDVGIGADGFVNVLFQKAESPFPETIKLPKGDSPLIFATVISDDEMIWSKTNGRENLLAKLKQANIGQISDLERNSVFHPKGINYASINSRESAAKMHEQGILRKAYLFPLEFGGEEIDVNTIYLPKSAYIQKLAFEQKVMQYAQDGLIDNYKATPEYKGKSFIPSSLFLQATGKEDLEIKINIF